MLTYLGSNGCAKELSAQQVTGNHPVLIGGSPRSHGLRSQFGDDELGRRRRVEVEDHQ
jgi:hypothetical protein